MSWYLSFAREREKKKKQKNEKKKKKKKKKKQVLVFLVGVFVCFWVLCFREKRSGFQEWVC